MVAPADDVVRKEMVSLSAALSGLSGSELAVLSSFAPQCAFLEYDNFIPLPAQADAGSIRKLIDRGALVCKDDKYALALGQVRVSCLQQVTRPTRMVDGPATLRADGWGKLECISFLLRNGWKASHECPTCYEIDSPKLFPYSALLGGVRSYMRSLCIAPLLFKKHSTLKRILHLGLDSYYTCLLKLKDVSAIAAMEAAALRALTDAECRRFLKGESVTLTIKDEDEQIETENEDEEDEPEPLRRKRARNATASAVISTKGAKINNKTLNAYGYDPITVYFDNYSGRGGYLRQYAVCNLHEVKEDLTLCRKYVYSKNVPALL